MDSSSPKAIGSVGARNEGYVYTQRPHPRRRDPHDVRKCFAPHVGCMRGIRPTLGRTDVHGIPSAVEVMRPNDRTEVDRLSGDLCRSRHKKLRFTHVGISE